ncbi:MAG: bifunctional methylenetetrahydrofolate dehydrogenase/methenyltetrahydrofolate cyclohydrolase FolD [Bacteroidales bacterium]|nr:bifunctional methylenetetrahydrofolate dehydrogenase/methenyltetrahydrofolate cyclohydrolase FolD [Bacteroidales bacterium]
MNTKDIDGKSIAATIKKEIAAEVAAMIDSGQKAPHLAAILVGHDPASESYVASKERVCHEVGMTSTLYRLPETTKESELAEVIRFLNQDEEVDGFIVQLPLPEHIDPDRIIALIAPEKDVDGFHPVNIGRLQLGQSCFMPATPHGIVEMLKRSNIELAGKHCVIIGRSNIVGTPLAVMLSRRQINATVTLCHSKTANLNQITRQADVLFVAIGQAGFVKKDMLKEGTVVVDVGINRVDDPSSPKGYRMAGDVDYLDVIGTVSRITPVPGGVGPMTIVSLLQNTLAAAKKTVYP